MFALYLFLSLVGAGLTVFFGFKGVSAVLHGKGSVKGFFKWLGVEIIFSSAAFFFLSMAIVSLFG